MKETAMITGWYNCFCREHKKLFFEGVLHKGDPLPLCPDCPNPDQLELSDTTEIKED